MADRKISELNSASRVFDKDYMVVVTGIERYKNPADPGQGYVDYVTTKIPLSGMAAWTFRVNEVVSGCTGIQIIPNINTGLVPPSINTIRICTTGVSYSGHTHVTSDISNFTSGVNSIVEQRIKFLSDDVSKTGTLTTVSGLTTTLNANTKYLCELGLISTATTSTHLSGLVTSTVIAASNNNLLNVYGTCNYTEPGTSQWNTVSSITGVTRIAGDINTGLVTTVHKFTVSTYVTESDSLNVQFGTNDTDGTIKAGSWLKVETIF